MQKIWNRSDCLCFGAENIVFSPSFNLHQVFCPTHMIRLFHLYFIDVIVRETVIHFMIFSSDTLIFSRPPR